MDTTTQENETPRNSGIGEVYAWNQKLHVIGHEGRVTVTVNDMAGERIYVYGPDGWERKPVEIPERE